MSILTINFKNRRSKSLAITGIFTGLYAIFNFIGIPEFSSFEHIINYICAFLFGPYVAVISSVAGELLLAPLKNPLFLPSVLMGNIATALILGFGRKLTPKFQKLTGYPVKKSRYLTESLVYVISLFVRYFIYIGYGGILVIIGIDYALIYFVVFFLIVTAFKAAWIPVCQSIIEAIRKNMTVVYFDREPFTIDQNAENNKIS